MRATCPIIGLLQGQGEDPGVFLPCAGLGPEVFDEPEQRVPYSAIDRLWGFAAECGIEVAGLRAAEQVTTSTYGVVSYLALCSPTVGAALEQTQRFFRLHSDGQAIDVTLDAGQVVIARRLTRYSQVRRPEQAARAELDEHTIAVLATYLNQSVGEDLASDAFFNRPAPKRLYPEFG